MPNYWDYNLSRRLILSVSANTTLDPLIHDTVLFDCSGGSKTATLPAVASAYDSTSGRGQIFRIKKIDSSANTLTLDGNASETIDGATTIVLSAQYDSLTVQAGPTEWSVL